MVLSNTRSVIAAVALVCRSNCSAASRRRLTCACEFDVLITLHTDQFMPFRFARRQTGRMNSNERNNYWPRRCTARRRCSDIVRMPSDCIRISGDSCMIDVIRIWYIAVQWVSYLGYIQIEHRCSFSSPSRLSTSFCALQPVT